MRARQTLEAIGDGEIREELYGASVQTLLEVVHGLPEGATSALLVGHDPGMHELALRLAGDDQRLERFPTGALAIFELESWAGSARLVDYVVPREL